MSICYIGVNMICIGLNYMNSQGNSPISDFHFHLLEFSATFVYALVGAFALVYTPKPLFTIYYSPCCLEICTAVNVLATFVAALLIVLDLEVGLDLSHIIISSSKGIPNS